MFARVKLRLDQAVALANSFEPEWQTASMVGNTTEETFAYINNWRQRRMAAEQAWQAIDQLAGVIEEEYRQATSKECRLPFLYTDRVRQALNAVWDVTEKSFDDSSRIKEQP
ncbi:MAG: hypothetical protein HC898_12165 [Phycisphaerales bacterium]|nr:hypothetical protein [Phycisphaerales bacterium]